jgi:hypothetical protein
LALCALAAGGPACTKSSTSPSVDRSDGTLPRLSIPKVAKNAISIDGKLDEKPWQTAAKSGSFVAPGDGRMPSRSPVMARARLLWSETHLYVGITVDDKHPTSPFARGAKDPHVWAKASGIELMLQPGDHGDNKQYFELQVDVNEAVWDTRFDDYNRPRRAVMVAGKRRMLYGHQSWDSKLERKVSIDKANERYTIEFALPWAALGKVRASLPPKSGDVWRANLYSFRDGQRYALAWSPIMRQGNFHKSSRFGKLVFE